MRNGFVEQVYCAFCRLERRVHFKKSANWTNVLLSLFAATAFMVVVWQSFDPRMILVFVLCIIASEIFVRIRWRLSLPCPHCGFDPLLYKTNREETVRKVKAKLQQVRQSDRYLLRANNPLEHLPSIVGPARDKKANSQSKSLSRHA